MNTQATKPTAHAAEVKYTCASCGDIIPSWDNEIGACPHGLLCNICRYENQCLQCKRARGEDEPDDLPDEAYDPDNFGDRVGYSR